MGSVQRTGENVFTVIAGGPSAEPPQKTAAAVSRSTSGRLEIGPAPVLAPQQSFPPLASQASNAFQSVVAFVGDGCDIVDDAKYRQRLEICRTCDRLNGNRCTACGCFIYVKARGRIFRCPVGRWE